AGAASCTPCPANSSAPAAGSSVCTTCPPGSFSAPGSATCTTCTAANLPLVTQQPVPSARRTHETFMFTVAASSTPATMAAPTYYWRHNGTTITDGGPYL